jgi:DNA-binding beta-propeller fold protein YncE
MRSVASPRFEPAHPRLLGNRGSGDGRCGCDPDAIAITPDGKTVNVANFLSGTVIPIRTATNTDLPAIKVGFDAVAIVITP